MQVQVDDLRPYLQAFDFQSLLVEGLGWDYYRAEPVRIHVDGHDYTLEPTAQKSGFVVYVCGPGADGSVPPYPLRRKIESQVAKLAYEHLIIFIDAGKNLQIWQWVRRESGKPNACREQTFHAGQTGEALLQRLQPLFVSLDEEPSLNIALVASRVRAALDVEKVTKQFYDRFRAELTAFQGFIDGITAQGDREWYASLMLNRMMFVYFVQKQGFLDGDVDYLRNRLLLVQSRRGSGRFQDFYRQFLLRLFHEGLGQPESERDPELADLLGRIPFLNGGLFDVHDLERDNPDISIPDEAFERVFSFFDGYRWHLDERPRREDNEINPDVLGYIFEKYVNQKQMGAYYTKEDITGYITRNTVIPFLFDAAKKECPVAFNAGGGVWRLLQDDPGRYIYPAVGHGMAWRYSPDADPVRLEVALELPEDIANGLDDVSQRSGWNRPAPGDYALPTETWREVVARRRRCREVRDKLAAGEVQEINDLITLNLDIERFARDVISQSEGPELLRAFWHALRDVSVLDPTCGSGAFLFAALNILEPLYTACLEGMRGFLDDLERTQRPRHQQTMSDFRDILKQADRHPSQRYFILKSIVLNNLYGVDIMEEAVEICKLRLFLKLVAQLESYDQIEPLPDIDFNIKAGNTLVGFTSLEAVRRAMTITPDGQLRALDAEQQKTLERIDEDAETASAVFEQFRWQQTLYGGEVTAADKAALRTRLDGLRDELDRYLATEYGVDTKKAAAYDAWRASHQPFHWFVEFYGIMSKGGFDVVIGNPPYVATKSIKYALGRNVEHRYSDIYAHVLERSMQVTSKIGRCGMILPLSITFSRDFVELRKNVRTWGTSWLSSFDNIPAALFAGVSQRCTILLSAPSGHHSFTTRLNRWRAQYRPSLLANISYTVVPSDYEVGSFGFPRLSGKEGERLLQLHSRLASKASTGLIAPSDSQGVLGFSPTARNFISTYLEPPPTLDLDGRIIQDAASGSSLTFASVELARAALAVTSGTTCFWYWLTRGDGFHVTNSLLSEYLAPLSVLPGECQHKLELIGEILHESRNAALVFKKNAGKYVGNFNYTGLDRLTVRADLVFLAGLGANRSDADNLLAFSSLVRAINDGAGEKNIPQRIKAMFPTANQMKTSGEERLKEVDRWLSRVFGLPVERLLEQYHLSEGVTDNATS